jgi:Cu-Zn family superoxide dismutase
MKTKKNKKKVKHAVAILHPDKHYSKKNRVKGRVKFTQKNNKLYINYNIQYLPKGYHGFHIHKYGDLTEGSSGTKIVSSKVLNLNKCNKNSIIGRSIIVHKDRDDLGKGKNLESLKTGNAGARLACGVIGISK